MKTGLLLEGGAMRGLYTAGVLDVLMKNNIQIDEIIGVSAGALFGMNYKSKQIGRVLRYNLKYSKEKNYMGFYSWFKTGNIMNEDFCFNKLVNELDPVDFKTFKESKTKFIAVITNIITGKAEYKEINDLQNHTNLEYLRASGSMPLVSKPIVINNNKYLDGGIADSIPIDKFMKLSCNKKIVILTRPLEYRKKKSNNILPKIYYKKYPNLLKTINNRYIKYNKDVEKIIELEKKEKIFVIRPSKVIKIKRIEKNPVIIQKMYDLGKSDAEKQLKFLKKYLNL